MAASAAGSAMVGELATGRAGPLDLRDDADTGFEQHGQHVADGGRIGGPGLDLGERDLCFARGKILSNADEDPVQHVHPMVSCPRISCLPDAIGRNPDRCFTLPYRRPRPSDRAARWGHGNRPEMSVLTQSLSNRQPQQHRLPCSHRPFLSLRRCCSPNEYRW